MNRFFMQVDPWKSDSLKKAEVIFKQGETHANKLSLMRSPCLLKTLIGNLWE